MLNTYSYYDYGLRPSYQCTVEAPNLEEAAVQAEERGLKMHRVTPVVGVRILVVDAAHPRTAAAFVVTQRFNTKQEALRHLRDEMKVEMAHPVYEYAYALGKEFDPLHAVTEVIPDLQAEYTKYGL